MENNQRIEFFYKGESLGKGHLPNFSTWEARQEAARKLRINKYDRWIIGGYDSDNLQKSNTIKGVKDEIELEVNSYTLNGNS